MKLQQTTDAVVARLFALAEGKNEEAAVRACEIILAYAWGKPRELNEASEADGEIADARKELAHRYLVKMGVRAPEGGQ